MVDNELLEAIGHIMDKKLEPINQRMAKLEAGQAKLETTVSTIQEDLEFTKNTVIKIENEHGQKLNALFDGQDRHEAAIDRLESKVDKIDQRLERLDVTVLTHDIRLDKLAK